MYEYDINEILESFMDQFPRHPQGDCYDLDAVIRGIRKLK